MARMNFGSTKSILYEKKLSKHDYCGFFIYNKSEFIAFRQKFRSTEIHPAKWSEKKAYIFFLLNQKVSFFLIDQSIYKYDGASKIKG